MLNNEIIFTIVSWVLEMVLQQDATMALRKLGLNNPNFGVSDLTRR